MQINEINLQKKQKQQEKIQNEAINFYQTTRDQEIDGQKSIMADSMNITHSIAIENVSESEERLPLNFNNRNQDRSTIQAPILNH